jgi:NAD+ diphosphatase
MPCPWGAFTSAERWEPDAALGPQTLLVVDSSIAVHADGTLLLLPGTAATVAPHALAVVPLAPRAEAAAVDAATAAALLGAGAALRTWRELAGAGGELRADAEAAVRAVALLAFHRAAAFSPADGVPTTMAAGGRRRTAGARTIYPRIDPVAIALVVSADGARVLLGRQAAWPAGLHSCVAGFVELGETAEGAAAREVLEETGVRVGAPVLVASQPWPIGRGGGAELMLASVARALDAAAEAVDVGPAAAAGGDGDGKGELEAARWFTRDEARAMLDAAAARESGAPFAPPRLAIAHALIRRFVEGALPAGLV